MAIGAWILKLRRGRVSYYYEHALISTVLIYNIVLRD